MKITIRSYYKHFNLKDINYDKKFWTTVKPLFSNKAKSAEIVFIDESGDIIKIEVDAANDFIIFL